MDDTLVDTRGLICPLPILRARKALRGVAPGQAIRILATDPAAVGDIEICCTQGGHEVLESLESDGEFSFLVRRAQKKS